MLKKIRNKFKLIASLTLGGILLPCAMAPLLSSCSIIEFFENLFSGEDGDLDEEIAGIKETRFKYKTLDIDHTAYITGFDDEVRKTTKM